MMAELFKGVPMLKNLVVLVCAALLLPAWAQSQGQFGAKTQPHSLPAQAKARADADITARLQARAIAEAAAQAAALDKASKPMTAQLPAGAAPPDGVPAFALPSRPTDAQAFAPMQPLPAWTEVQSTQRETPVTPSLTAMPATVPALAAVQPLPPVAAGLAATAPVAQSASDPVSQELAIAQQIHLGLMPCEMGASVRVEADAAAPGYFHVQGKGFRYRMYPVRTSTGALRLEDKKAGAVWLQLANKSMLMDQKKGRRVADECAHPEQLAYGQDMRTNPPPSLFDKTGMGRSND
jgi:hypothetical protein